MSNTTQTLLSPPWTKNSDGAIRKVGVELEINGMELDTLAHHVAEFLDLSIDSNGRYERVLKGDSAGDWIIELDFNLLKKIGREERGHNSLSEEAANTAEEMLALAAKAVVPLEVVSPPLPLDRLSQFEELIKLLRNKGAKGTSDNAVNAFGMQFNPELPSLDAEMITRCLKAFVCLYDWIFERANINLSRRVTSYVNPYPTDYVKKIIAADYWPNLDTLIDDYLLDNSTRNRALDMLPLFAFLDKERVDAKTDDVLIKARPTFHYRLPDCEIDLPDWGLCIAWNDWVRVEELAADKERLDACCEAYHDHLDSTFERIFKDWSKIVEREWLNP